jgi:hypothetical protein
MTQVDQREMERHLTGWVEYWHPTRLVGGNRCASHSSDTEAGSCRTRLGDGRWMRCHAAEITRSGAGLCSCLSPGLNPDSPEMSALSIVVIAVDLRYGAPPR